MVSKVSYICGSEHIFHNAKADIKKMVFLSAPIYIDKLAHWLTRWWVGDRDNPLATCLTQGSQNVQYSLQDQFDVSAAFCSIVLHLTEDNQRMYTKQDAEKHAQKDFERAFRQNMIKKCLSNKW